ncbi:hypothetical protein [Pseudonocardia sediminis]|uniref:hypothetical protein n=1 Tax=Pseudonocardia sediminis TaxID=1397368 RepID=UPI0010289E35|nr:hypothetical protein [Pseudonocardia sediminis]
MTASDITAPAPGPVPPAFGAATVAEYDDYLGAHRLVDALSDDDFRSSACASSVPASAPSSRSPAG